jgi:DNA-binding response OmpR family regulator
MDPIDILVVEDEPSISEVVALYLRRAGYRVTAVADGEAALAALARGTPGLVVLDLMLPKVDGYEITRWLRARGDVPIIMLTSRREEADRIAGLEMGADDYVVKPFSPQELVSRVRAVLRRASAATAGGPGREAPVVQGDLSVDPVARVVTVRGVPCNLTTTEFDLLYLFAMNPRRVFTRDQLLDRVWGLTEYIDPSTVTVHIRRLREKIEADPAAPQHIVTVWGVGYKFEP